MTRNLDFDLAWCFPDINLGDDFDLVANYVIRQARIERDSRRRSFDRKVRKAVIAATPNVITDRLTAVEGISRGVTIGWRLAGIPGAISGAGIGYGLSLIID